MIALFHGSDHVVSQPSLALARPRNDYGPGFYCTRDIELAKEWACKNGKDGYACRYHVDEDHLRALDLLDGTHSVLEWIALLLKNRTFSLSNPIAEEARTYLVDSFASNTLEYDLVIGYRADDSYFAYAQAFVENGLTIEQLERALFLGNLGEQTVLISDRAFEALRFVEAVPYNAADYYPRFAQRDLAARTTYRNSVRSAHAEGMFVMDLIRQGVSADALRIQRAISR